MQGLCCPGVQLVTERVMLQQLFIDSIRCVQSCRVHYTSILLVNGGTCVYTVLFLQRQVSHLFMYFKDIRPMIVGLGLSVYLSHLCLQVVTLMRKRASDAEREKQRKLAEERGEKLLLHDSEGPTLHHLISCNILCGEV